MNFLGKNIRFLRKKTSRTQSELATLIGKGQTTIGNWENGISEPSLDELLLLSNYFDTTLDILIRIDLSQTNWNVEKGYDHAAIPGSKVEETRAEYGTLQELVKELKVIREEIDRINSRLSSLE